MELTAAIRDLQHMLNQLARRNPALLRLAENGVFDELTLEAVMIFQRDFFPPVTGIVNEATWYAIVDAYRQEQLQFGDPLELRVLPNGEFSAPYESAGYPKIIAEAIFLSLPDSVSNFSGALPEERILILQRLAGIPDNGALNRATWEFLARLYHAAVVRKAFEHSVL